MRRQRLRNEMIKVRVGSDEKRELAALARRNGMTISQLLRDGARSLARQVAA